MRRLLLFATLLLLLASCLPASTSPAQLYLTRPDADRTVQFTFIAPADEDARHTLLNIQGGDLSLPEGCTYTDAFTAGSSVDCPLGTVAAGSTVVVSIEGDIGTVSGYVDYSCGFLTTCQESAKPRQ